jgi:hypothetical protein
MSATGGFDVVLQFRPDVVCDIITRQLSDPLALSAQSHKFVQRYLTLEAVLPSALSWGDPTVGCASDDKLLAAVTVTGGIRPAALNHNVTITASISAPLTPVIRRAASGALYVEADIGSAAGLALGEVQAGMAGVNAPVPLVGADLSQALEPLRPFLAQNLFQSLARLSHTYIMSALPADLAPTRAGVRALTGERRAALALGLGLTSAPSDTSPMTSAFAEGEPGNVALALSVAGLNWLIARALARNELRGSGRDAAQTPWRWTSLVCASADAGQLGLSGNLEASGQARAVAALVSCALDAQGRLSVTPTSPLDPFVIAAIQSALARVLGASEDGKLQQVFTIPDSSVAVNVSAQTLRMEPDGVTLLYDAPLKGDRIMPQFPARTPVVSVTQRLPLPVASRPGAPVTASLRAQAVSESFPPYDLEWRTDSAPVPTAGPERQVIGTPADMTPGTHTLTTARLRLIDLIGQVATADQPVQYTVRPRRRIGRTAAIAAALALVIALTLGGVAVASGGLRFPIVGAPQVVITPTPTFTPTPTQTPVIAFRATLSGPAFGDGVWAQECKSQGVVLDPTTLTLDNTGSNVPVSWQVSFANDPNANLAGDQVWSSASDASSGAPAVSGTTDPGAATTLTITPDSKLCAWLTPTNTQTSYTFTLALTYNPANPDIQQPVTFTDLVLGPVIVIQ